MVEQAETEFMVRALGYIKNKEDVANIVVGADAQGTPILIKASLLNGSLQGKRSGRRPGSPVMIISWGDRLAGRANGS